MRIVKLTITRISDGSKHSEYLEQNSADRTCKYMEMMFEGKYSFDQEEFNLITSPHTEIFLDAFDEIDGK